MLRTNLGNSIKSTMMKCNVFECLSQTQKVLHKFGWMFCQDTQGPQPNSYPLYSPTFVTELACPAQMTDALPGLVAGTMLAARHSHTALAVQPFPAWVTPDKEKHRGRALGRAIRGNEGGKNRASRKQDF